MAVSFTGAYFPQAIMLLGVRWYGAYPVSDRHMEELMEERWVAIDHVTIQRWVVKDSSHVEDAFHRRKRPVWLSWRMDEPDIRITGGWRYRYRAVEEVGQTIDFLWTEPRAERAAKRFLTKAICRHGVPDKRTIDGSATNAAAIRSDKKAHGTSIDIRQLTDLNKTVEQDHPGMKRITRPRLGFKSFEVAQATLVGIELMHMLCKGQLAIGVGQGLTTAEPFATLAA